MVWYPAHVIFFLLVINPAFIYSFNRGRVTEKPNIASGDNSNSPKQPKPPTHISEFTDPHTGLNPFLDLEEGPTSLGRNVMEDERRDDAPYLDFDVVEGESSHRRWDLDDDDGDVKASEKIPARWPIFEDGGKDDSPILTTPSVFQKLPTTMELFITSSTEGISSKDNDRIEETWEKMQNDNETKSTVTLDMTMISALATTAVIIAVILLIGACWWRKKLKLSRSSSSTENREFKS